MQILFTESPTSLDNKLKPLRAVILGFGVVGSRRYKILRDLDVVEIKAISEKKTENLSSLPTNISKYQDYKDLLKNEEFEIVFVSLPNRFASDATLLALESNAHVFCEKPPARSSIELKPVLEYTLKHKDLKLMYGFNHRFHSSALMAKEIIESGELGQIVNMKGTYGKSKMITFNQTDWRSKREESGGGILLDQGIHMLDLIRYFSNGVFEEVYSCVDNNFWGHDVEDNAFALMRSKTGIVAQLHSSATQWRHSFQLDITLNKGSIILDGILSGSKSYGEEKLRLIKCEPRETNPELSEEEFKFDKDISWDSEISYFIDSVIHDTPILKSNVNDAMEILLLVERIYKSDKTWFKKFLS